MKSFIAKVACFAVLIAVLLAGAVFLVPSPEMSESLLSMAPVKHALLRETPSPRIILVGGSNLSHGLNSRIIHEAFALPVVNMGLHGGLGLRFMLEEVRPFVEKGDVVVVTPEYSQYEQGGFWGNKELLGIICDVMPEMRQRISVEQGLHLLKYAPNYGARKMLNVGVRLFQRRNASSEIRHAYNSFGDYTGHWNQAPLFVSPVAQVEKPDISRKCFDTLESFVLEMRDRGARVAIMPPSYQASSYDRSLPLVERVEKELWERGLPLLAPMRRYRMEDHLCYDTPYHLVRAGVERRTRLFVSDLRAGFKGICD